MEPPPARKGGTKASLRHVRVEFRVTPCVLKFSMPRISGPRQWDAGRASGGRDAPGLAIQRFSGGRRAPGVCIMHGRRRVAEFTFRLDGGRHHCRPICRRKGAVLARSICPSTGCKVCRGSHFRPPDRSQPTRTPGKSNRAGEMHWEAEGLWHAGPPREFYRTIGF